MSKYRTNLPQLSNNVFLTDGGLETTLIFHDGIDIPHFASFDLIGKLGARQALRRYFDHYAEIAKADGVGLVLESATWRASADWGKLLNYSMAELEQANRQAVADLEDVRAAHETPATPIVISGNIGPRGDGYDPGLIMSVEEAQTYHSAQVGTFKDSAADMVSALTMTNVPEAIGVTRAAQVVGMPVVISFTVETDGHLPTGQPLGEAIEAVDAATENGPVYYMVNCAHPTHFDTNLATDDAWIKRVRGIRANASCLSHAELDEAEELDEGNPVEFGQQLAALRRRHPQISILGGCCGTDHRHIEQVSHSCKGGTKQAA